MNMKEIAQLAVTAATVSTRSTELGMSVRKKKRNNGNH